MFSSFVLDTNDVYNYMGHLRKKDCEKDCPSSLRIRINGNMTSPAGAPAIADSALKSGVYSYVRGPEMDYDVSFKSSYNKSAVKYEWDFGDGYTAAGADPVHRYTEAGKYKVCLKITSNGQCVSSICNDIEVGTNPAGAYVEVQSGSMNTLTFRAVIRAQAPFIYDWDFGDGTRSSNALPTHKYPVQGAYPVVLTVRDAANRTVVTRYNAVTFNDTSSCAANAWASFIKPVPGVNVFNLSGVEVSWTDENGLTYSSDNVEQPLSSKFEILSVEDFGLNENNQKTKKITVRFTCMVYGGGASMALNNGEAVFCVAYP